MPVTNTYTPAAFTGNGVSTVFAYGFKIFAAAELLVKVAGVTKTLTTDYTVNGVGAENGGSITFTAAPANGVSVTIERNLPYTRSEDYQRNGAFDEFTVDRDFDRRQMQIQQLAEKAGRALTGPVADGEIPELPSKTARANKYLAFDSNGDPIASAAAQDGAPVSAYMETMLDDANAAAVFATLGVSAFIQTLLDDADANAARATLEISSDDSFALVDIAAFQRL